MRPLADLISFSVLLGTGSSVLAQTQEVPAPADTAKTTEAAKAPNLTAVSPYYTQGLQFYRNNQIAKAVIYFEADLKQRKDKQTLVNYYLGNTYLKMGRTDEAMAQYKAAYAADPTSETGWYSKSALDKLAAIAKQKTMDYAVSTEADDID